MQCLGKNDYRLTSGGTLEVLQRADEDKLEDMLINRDCREITEFAETPMTKLTIFYHPTPPIFRNENHLYHIQLVLSLFICITAIAFQTGSIS
jgi:hypothetical protein